MFELIWLIINMTDFWSRDLHLNQNMLRWLDRSIVVFTFFNLVLLLVLIAGSVFLARQGFSNQHRPFKDIWDFKPADRRYQAPQNHPDVL